MEGRTVRAARLPRARAVRPSRLPAVSVRSLLIGAGIVVAAVGVYALARETSLFAVRTIDVAGGSPRVKAEVRRALEPELGKSLLRVDRAALALRVEALPDVVSASFDRSFPHTLDVDVQAERGVLLIRQGNRASWVVSARGRVMRKVARPKRSSLPRLWLPKTVAMTPGETLPASEGKLAAAAVAPIAAGAFPGGIKNVSTRPGSLTLVLNHGPQIRLGGIGDLRLKLAIARRIVRYAAEHDLTSATYVDVSVPERPVMGTS
jgi:hypothetical protein